MSPLLKLREGVGTAGAFRDILNILIRPPQANPMVLSQNPQLDLLEPILLSRFLEFSVYFQLVGLNIGITDALIDLTMGLAVLDRKAN